MNSSQPSDPDHADSSQLLDLLGELLTLSPQRQHDRLNDLGLSAGQRHLLEDWLRVHGEAEGFLEDRTQDIRAIVMKLASDFSATGADQPAETASLNAPKPEQGEIPNNVDHYRILQRIGEGGMAIVFKAEQQHPVRRIVALKVIKPGLESKEIISRFEAERQALAVMNHPNVAKVFDAGISLDGRPYFVMEYIPGEPITTYCDRHKLTIRQRLELFIHACEAVHHSHQKAIIHRDIKPSNVLVMVTDGKPVVKVIDFGVAKALDHRLTEHTLFTERGQIIGTPEYMSPEQAEMGALDVDIRTDIYSLGVLLYELLAGVLPFDSNKLREMGLPEMQRMIREVEPARPSTRLSTAGEQLSPISTNRNIDGKKLTRLLRGELDWIVLKAMEKDRTRRYETAHELAADIRRFLENETILARPPSRAYRAKKFVRRHRISVAAAAAVTLALVLGIVGTSYGLHKEKLATLRAQDEAKKSKIEADKANAVRTFVQQMISVDPAKGKGADVRLRQVLDDASKRIESGIFKEQPWIEAVIRNTLGVSYRNLGLTDQAERHFRVSLNLFEQTQGLECPDGAKMLYFLGTNRIEQDNPDAIPLLSRALEIAQRTSPKEPYVADILKRLGYSYHHLARDNATAERFLREAISNCESRRDKAGAADAMVDMGNVCRDLGKFDEALDWNRQAREIHLHTDGADTYMVAQDWFAEANALVAKGDVDAAEPAIKEAIRIRRKLLTMDHDKTRSIVWWWAETKLEKHDYANVLTLLNDLWGSVDKKPNPAPDPDLHAFVASRIAEVYAALGKPQESCRWHAVWTEIMRDQIQLVTLYLDRDPADPKYPLTRATFYLSIGAFSEALADLMTVRKIVPDNLQWAWSLPACLLLHEGDEREYHRLCRLMLEQFPFTGELKSSERRTSAEQIAKICLARPDSDTDLPRLRDMVLRAMAPPGEEHWLRDFHVTLGLAEYRLGHYQAAIDFLKRGDVPLTSRTNKAISDLVLAMAYHNLHRAEEAHASFQNALHRIQELPQPGIGDLRLGDPDDWFICKVLLQEASRIIEHRNQNQG